MLLWVQEGKIVELAKKNRALNLALEKERAKSGRLTQAPHLPPPLPPHP